MEKPGFTKGIKSTAEKRQPSDDIASLDHQHCFEGVPQGVPEDKRVLSRMVQQHRHKAFRCFQIADEEGDWARRIGQRITQRKRVIDCSSVLDIGLGGAHGLVRKSLEPEDPRERRTRSYLLVELEADRMRPVNGGNISSEHALDVTPSIGLVSQVM